MSHFTGTIVIPATEIDTVTAAGTIDLTEGMVQFLINDRMEIFNENREVDPYQDEILSAAEGELPKDAKVFKFEYADLLEEKKVTADVDWPQFLTAINNAEDNTYGWDAATRTVTRTITYNPDGHWDWWVIGGRWKGNLILADGSTADFARVKDLSITRMQNKGTVKAAQSWIVCNEYFDRLGRPKPWKHFRDLRNEGVLDDNQMRKQYHGQPAVEALRNDEKISAWSGADEIDAALEDFGTVIENAKASALATYCYITTEDEWMAPGSMGWFGMSTETDDEQHNYEQGYVKWLDSLDPDDVIVVVDMHV